MKSLPLLLVAIYSATSGCSSSPDFSLGSWRRISINGTPITLHNVDRLSFSQDGAAERQLSTARARGRWGLSETSQLTLYWPESTWTGEALNPPCASRCLELRNAETDDMYSALFEIGGVLYDDPPSSATDAGSDTAGVEAHD